MHLENGPLQQFRPAFAEVKRQFDESPSMHDGLICKFGFYMDSLVLKLQKPSWTNDSMDQIENKSGIFFSIWINEDLLSMQRANYNIHALKLRHLNGYSITSRDFASDFRKRFALLQDEWPNVSLEYGPLTLMQGWIDLDLTAAIRDMTLLMRRFEQLTPLIDSLLESRLGRYPG